MLAFTFTCEAGLCANECSQAFLQFLIPRSSNIEVCEGTATPSLSVVAKEVRTYVMHYIALGFRLH